MSEPEQPGRTFDLSEQDAVDIVHHLQQFESVFDLHVCIGGVPQGTTQNARSVEFGFRLDSGHHVTASIHSPETTDGPALNESPDSDEASDLLRELFE